MLNESFLPQSGGVVALDNLSSQGSENSSKTVSHPFLVSNALAGQTVGTIPARLTYNGPDGTQYNEVFSITLQLIVYSGPVWTQTPTPTVTAAPVVRPQIVVSSYQTDVDPLQPGTIFNLDLDVRNLGNADARSVTMVLGGGVTPDVSGTLQPGGVSGGSGDLTNFAPVGSSNMVLPRRYTRRRADPGQGEINRQCFGCPRCVHAQIIICLHRPERHATGRRPDHHPAGLPGAKH